MSLVRIHISAEGLRTGELEWLERELLDYDAPFDLQAPPVGGSRAVDSVLVAHTGDRITTGYAYTATGRLHAKTPQELEVLYWRVKRQLKYADQIWRGDRYLKIAGAVIAGETPGRGQTFVPAPIVARVKELRWYDAQGRALE